MIGYVTLGVKDLDSAAAFYDELLATLGGTRFMQQEGYFIAWKAANDGPSLGVTIPFNQAPATAGNGTMVALLLKTPAEVEALHSKALQLGGSCEGAPGFRPPNATAGFYCGYFRDLDGNKLNAFCIVDQPS